MKYLNILIVALCLCLSSCSGNDEPKANVQLTIFDSFLPASITINRTDTELTKECKKFSSQTFIVNSKDELPQDPFGSDETFSKIGYNNQSLLICYQVHSYDIISYDNKFIKNNTDKTYDWTVTLGINGDAVDSFDQLIFTRYAILVPKLPKNATLKVWFGVRSYSWDWDE
ncbi:MAG: hypothetical protein NC095_01870 [Muribaculum sp.]|nr:hypothetical protein [Muribaculum sp.]